LIKSVIKNKQSAPQSDPCNTDITGSPHWATLVQFPACVATANA
jgi:hypothetical protein